MTKGSTEQTSDVRRRLSCSPIRPFTLAIIKPLSSPLDRFSLRYFERNRLISDDMFIGGYVGICAELKCV